MKAQAPEPTGDQTATDASASACEGLEVADLGPS